MPSKLALNIYNKLLHKHPEALTAYARYKLINEDFHKKHKLQSKLYLLKLLRAEKKSQDLYTVKVPKNAVQPFNHISLKNYLNDSNKYIAESQKINRESIDDFIKSLMPYDVISFDIFDTAIFRPFQNPTDLFYLLECKLNIIDFVNLRIKAEADARKKHNNQEIELIDIYEQLSKYCNVSKKDSNLEIEFEKELCYANPYILQVFNKLKDAGKTIIFVSDMYLPKDAICDILKKNGYNDFKKLYVSNSYKKTKWSGELFEIVKKDFKNGTTFIHIGDNLAADIDGAKKAGFDCKFYQQCNEFGKNVRPSTTSTPTLSLYNGIINNYLYNGAYIGEVKQDFAFAYAGIITSAFCEWLNEFAKNNNCDQILFLGRDMKVVSDVYNKHYVKVKNNYATVSRIALQEIIIKDNPFEFFDNNIKCRCNKGYSLNQIFNSLDLDFVLNDCNKYNLKPDDLLSFETLEKVEAMFLDKVDLIDKKYKDAEVAAKLYFKEMLNSSKKPCIVDLGWRGSIIRYLKYLLVDKWKLCDDIKGVLFGANKRSLDWISQGLITPFAYSPIHNKEILCGENWTIEYMRIMALEAIFTSGAPSLIEYQLDKKLKTYKLKTYKENKNKEIVETLHKGIMNFVDEFERFRKPYRKVYPISADECLTPMLSVIDNYEYVAKVLGDCVDTQNELAILNDDEIKYITLSEKMLNLGIFDNIKNKEDEK